MYNTNTQICFYLIFKFYLLRSSTLHTSLQAGEVQLQVNAGAVYYTRLKPPLFKEGDFIV